jgi:hypothetical protein
MAARIPIPASTGLSYQPVWPNGNTVLHPQPFLFSSPLTGPGDSVQYSRTAFETNLPRLQGGHCLATGVRCNRIPITDKGTPAAFYPFYSAFRDGVPNEQGDNGCMWAFGDDLPGATTDFGRNAQYGPVLGTSYLIFGGGGAAHTLFNNFRQIMPNPRPAEGNQQH